MPSTYLNFGNHYQTCRCVAAFGAGRALLPPDKTDDKELPPNELESLWSEKEEPER